MKSFRYIWSCDGCGEESSDELDTSTHADQLTRLILWGWTFRGEEEAWCENCEPEGDA